MLPEINIEFLEDCLIQVLSGEPKTLRELAEATNFDRIFVVHGLSLLENAGVVERGKYKILREPTETAKGLASQTYRLTIMWQDVYAPLYGSYNREK